MQAGAVQWKNPPFYRIDELITRLGRVSDQARRNAVPIYYAQHHTPGGFPVYGSPQWELVPEIGPQAGDVVIHKSTPDVFLNTPLHGQLQSRGVDQLVIGGIQTADCVDTACRRAFGLGYRVMLLSDGHTTFPTPELSAQQIIAHHNRVIGNWFGKLVASDHLDFGFTP